MRRIAAAITLCLAATLAPAQSPDWRAAASPYDIERLDMWEGQLDYAAQEVRMNGAGLDLSPLDSVLQPPMPIGGEALIGDWKCRTMKLGGIGTFVSYSWFNCRISYGEEGLFFEKLSGSQRTAGYLWPVYPASGEGFPVKYVYLGAAHYADEPQGRYGGPANRLRNDTANSDDPGILEALGPDHLRIGFPKPIFESDFDFLELKR